MRKFESGDIIGFRDPENGYGFYIVCEVENNYLLCVPAEDENAAPVDIPVTAADYYPPVEPDEENLKKFIRYEIPFSRVTKKPVPPVCIKAAFNCVISPEDLLAAVGNMHGKTLAAVRNEWLGPFAALFGRVIFTNEETNGVKSFIPTEGIFTEEILTRLYINAGRESTWYAPGMLDGIEEKLALVIDSRNKKPWERPYTDEIKKAVIKAMDDKLSLDGATDDELEFFTRVTEELCSKGSVTALRIKAYGHYNGNRAFPRDFEKSEDALLKLYEKCGDADAANSLGYIYYYGRRTDGKPEYDKAFYWYTIGAAAGIYESRYKLCDMFTHGYGTPVNKKIASAMTVEMYSDNIKFILDGKTDSKFADIALRMGNIFRDGTGEEKSADLAFFFYLQARFALRLRMRKNDYFGDEKVLAAAEKSIGDILPELSSPKPVNTVHFSSVGNLLLSRFPEKRSVKMKIKSLSDGNYSVKFTIVPKTDEKYPPRFFMTDITSHFCGFTDSICAKTEELNAFPIINGKKLKDGSAEVIFDEASHDSLTLAGQTKALFNCGFVCVMPKREKTLSFASVTFSPGGNRYDYLCDDKSLKPGDFADVTTDDGIKEVRIEKLFECTESECPISPSKYKPLIPRKKNGDEK